MCARFWYLYLKYVLPAERRYCYTFRCICTYTLSVQPKPAVQNNLREPIYTGNLKCATGYIARWVGREMYTAQGEAKCCVCLRPSLVPRLSFSRMRAGERDPALSSIMNTRLAVSRVKTA